MLTRIRALGARRLLVITLAVGLVGVVTVPTILAASGPATRLEASTAVLGANPVANPLAAPGTIAGRLGTLTGRILRADATVLKRDGSTATVHIERGEVTALDAAAVTVKGADGVSTTFAITSQTRFRDRGRQAAIGDFKVGDAVGVMGIRQSDGLEAYLVRHLLGRAGGGGGLAPASTAP